MDETPLTSENNGSQKSNNVNDNDNDNVNVNDNVKNLQIEIMSQSPIGADSKRYGNVNIVSQQNMNYHGKSKSSNIQSQSYNSGGYAMNIQEEGGIQNGRIHLDTSKNNTKFFGFGSHQNIVDTRSISEANNSNANMSQHPSQKRSIYLKMKTQTLNQKFDVNITEKRRKFISPPLPRKEVAKKEVQKIKTVLTHAQNFQFAFDVKHQDSQKIIKRSPSKLSSSRLSFNQVPIFDDLPKPPKLRDSIISSKLNQYPSIQQLLTPMKLETKEETILEETFEPQKTQPNVAKQVLNMNTINPILSLVPVSKKRIKMEKIIRQRTEVKKKEIKSQFMVKGHQPLPITENVTPTIDQAVNSPAVNITVSNDSEKEHPADATNPEELTNPADATNPAEATNSLQPFKYDPKYNINTSMQVSSIGNDGPATQSYLGLSSINRKASQEMPYINSSNLHESNYPREQFMFDTSRISLSQFSKKPDSTGFRDTGSTYQLFPQIQSRSKSNFSSNNKILDLAQKIEESKASKMTPDGQFLSKNMQNQEKEVSLKRVLIKNMIHQQNSQTNRVSSNIQANVFGPGKKPNQNQPKIESMETVMSVEYEIEQEPTKNVSNNDNVTSNIYDYEDNLNHQVIKAIDRKINRIQNKKSRTSHIRHNSVMEIRKPLETINEARKTDENKEWFETISQKMNKLNTIITGNSLIEADSVKDYVPNSTFIPNSQALRKNQTQIQKNPKPQKNPYLQEIKQLIESSKLENLQFRHSKYIFNDDAKIIGISPHKQIYEIYEQKDRERSARKKMRIEAIREKIRNHQEVDRNEEIDGISSASSINSFAGVVGTDTRKVAEYQNLQQKLIYDKIAFEGRIKNHKALQPYKKQQFLQQFDRQNQAKIDKILDVDDIKETQEIIDKMANPGNWGQIMMARQSVLIKEEKIKNPKEPIAEYLGQFGYDPDQITKVKKKFMEEEDSDFSRQVTQITQQQDLPDFVQKYQNQQMVKLAKNSQAYEELLKKDANFQVMFDQLAAGVKPTNLKIYAAEKHLIIQDESITKVNVDSLVVSAKKFGNQIQKITFDNINMKDTDFARFLEILNDLKSFKSIVYRKNEFGQNSIKILKQLLAKKVPNHLEELRIENCQLPTQVTEDLLDALCYQSALKSLALVNVNIPSDCFKDLGRYIKKAQYLEKIDISDNNILNSELYENILKNMAKNKLLRDINISHNKLGGSKIYKHLKNIVSGQNIQHVNLTNCNLDQEMIIKLCSWGKKSLNLQSLHFSGNPGVTPELRKKLYYLLQYKMKHQDVIQKNVENVTIPQGVQVQYKHRGIIPKPEIDTMKVVQSKSAKKQKQDQNEVLIENDKKLIVSRILGQTHLNKNLEKWKQENECWICERYKFSLILVNEDLLLQQKQLMISGMLQPLIQTRDFEKTDEYSFYGESNNFEPQEMFRIQDFCKIIDKKLPDFIEVLKNEKKCRKIINNIEQFNKDEQREYYKLVKQYQDSYRTNYQQIISKNLKHLQIINPGLKGDIFCWPIYIKPGHGRNLVIGAPINNKYDFIQFKVFASPRTHEIEILDPQKSTENQEAAFIREITIFADYKVDDNRLLDQCFNHDKKYWKLDRLTKIDLDYKETLKVIRDNYKFLKDVFIFIASQSKYPFISMADFLKFGEHFKDAILNQSAIENVFIAANQTSSVLEDKKQNESNPPNMLIRFKFVEAIVRCGQAKYRSRAKELYSQTALIIEDLKSMDMPNMALFRKNLLWTNSIAHMFKKQEASLKLLMQGYIERHPKEKYMTLNDVISLFQNDCSLQMKERDIIFLQGMSKMTNPDEINPNSAFKYNRFRFAEFIDLIGSISEFNFRGSELEGISLDEKISFTIKELTGHLKTEHTVEQDSSQSEQTLQSD